MLFCNPGGRTLFNLYRLKDGRLLFRDKDWDYLVDVSKQQVFWLKSAEGKLYTAQIPNEEVTSWSGPAGKGGKNRDVYKQPCHSRGRCDRHS